MLARQLPRMTTRVSIESCRQCARRRALTIVGSRLASIRVLLQIVVGDIGVVRVGIEQSSELGARHTEPPGSLTLVARRQVEHALGGGTEQLSRRGGKGGGLSAPGLPRP